MKKIYLLAISMCITSGLQAQNTTSTPVKNCKELTAAEKAIQQYNFEDATTLLQKRLQQPNAISETLRHYKTS